MSGIEERREEHDAVEVTSPAPPHGEVGARIAGVLNAAEQAAAQIRADARRAAEAERRRVIDNARAYAASVRRDADAETGRILAAAHAAADVIRDRANAEAEHVEEDARLRRDELHIDARLLEQRVERAVDALRHVSSELAGVAARARVSFEPADPREEDAATASSPTAGADTGT